MTHITIKKYDMKFLNNTYIVYATPSATAWIMKDANTTNQPHPPSGAMVVVDNKVG